MSSVELIILFAVAIAAVVAFMLRRKSRRKPSAGAVSANSLPEVAQSELEAWIKTLVRRPDPLADILSLANNANSAPGQLEHFPELVGRLTRRLSEIDLYPIGVTGEIAQFNPGIHRSDSRVYSGSPVRIVYSGWRLKDKLITPAYVVPLQKEGVE